MSEFEFLDKQFHRLSEARSACARKTVNTDEWQMAECWRLALQGSIRDYLAMREQKAQQP